MKKVVAKMTEMIADRNTANKHARYLLQFDGIWWVRTKADAPFAQEIDKADVGELFTVTIGNTYVVEDMFLYDAKLDKDVPHTNLSCP